jgi:CheY-like chemotaxis protein
VDHEVVTRRSLPKRALVVDDDTVVSEFVAVCLADRFSVTTASSGAEALALFQADPFDVAFVDVNMPGMSGLDLLRAVREISPRTPVVVLSADGGNESLALEADATAFVHKDPDRFARGLESVIVLLCSTPM